MNALFLLFAILTNFTAPTWPVDPWSVIIEHGEQVLYTHDDGCMAVVYSVSNYCSTSGDIWITVGSTDDGGKTWYLLQHYALTPGMTIAETINYPQVAYQAHCWARVSTGYPYNPGKYLMWPTDYRNFIPEVYYDGSSGPAE